MNLLDNINACIFSYVENTSLKIEIYYLNILLSFDILTLMNLFFEISKNFWMKAKLTILNIIDLSLDIFAIKIGFLFIDSELLLFNNL